MVISENHLAPQLDHPQRLGDGLHPRLLRLLVQQEKHHHTVIAGVSEAQIR